MEAKMLNSSTCGITRTILFRGFCRCEDGDSTIRVLRDNEYEKIVGKWVYGNFVSPCNIVYEEDGYDEVLKRENVPIGYDYPVIPETVGQYVTCDKEGKRIFEGDCVVGKNLDGDTVEAILCWVEEGRGFMFEDFNHCYWHFLDNLRLIGTCFDIGR